jgi:hypothetical protein
MRLDPMVHAQFLDIRRRGILCFSLVNSTIIITTSNMLSITLTAAEHKAALLEAWRQWEQVEWEAQVVKEYRRQEERVQEKEIGGVGALERGGKEEEGGGRIKAMSGGRESSMGERRAEGQGRRSEAGEGSPVMGCHKMHGRR